MTEATQGYVISDLKKRSVDELIAEVLAELSPVYHVTPGGLRWSLRWSRSTDALREIAARLKATA